MSKVLAIDYGLKRTGLAMTDELQIIASGLTTVATKDIFDFLKALFAKEQIELIVLGEPKDLLNRASETHQKVMLFKSELIKRFPKIPVQLLDERFTSKLAQQTINQTVKGRKKRRNKALIDEISATILLQSYLLMKDFQKQREQ